jgi:tRNA(Ile)-lysidine synthase
MKPFAAGVLMRPLLHQSRQSLLQYAHHHQLTWIEDDSNQDTRFSRNYLRHQILPLLTAKWPAVVANLCRSVDHCQQARHNLDALALLDCPDLLTTKSTLPLALITTSDSKRLANVLRHWLKKNEVRLPSTEILSRILEDVIGAAVDSEPCVAWDAVCVRRYQNVLYLLPQNRVGYIDTTIDWLMFPEPLLLCNDGRRLTATRADAGLYVPQGAHIQVRRRQGGERFFWRGQTKSLKKLLQFWRIPPWLRDELPLIYIDNNLAAVAGFAVSDRWYGCQGTDTYHIECHTESSCLDL